MKPLVKLVCASCGTTVGKISRNDDGAMVRERTERTRYFEGGGAAPHGFPSEGAMAARLIDTAEKVIDDPRAGAPDLFDHPAFAYSTICKKCTATVSISQGDLIKALNAAEAMNKVRRAVLHPMPDP